MPDAKPSLLGPVGHVVVDNIRELSAGLTLRALSGRLDAIGQPIKPTVLHRLQQRGRRVDADDLVALSLVLGVNPNALLFPRDTAQDAEVALTPEVRASAWAVWAWADGRTPLPASPDEEKPGERFTREAGFSRRARPVFGQGPALKAMSELYELGDRIEAFAAAADPAVRAMLRDRVLRQVRQFMPALEETLADDDAAAQLRDAARTLPAPAIGAPGQEETRA